LVAPGRKRGEAKKQPIPPFLARKEEGKKASKISFQVGKKKKPSVAVCPTQREEEAAADRNLGKRKRYIYVGGGERIL